MEIRKKYLLIGGVALLTIGFVGYMAAFVVPRTFVSLTKAAPATIVSFADSYILADKIVAMANGKDEARINVYVLDKSGKGVSKKNVTIDGVANFTPESVLTDSSGLAKFKLTSTTEGQFKISALVEGIELGKNITVTFRN